MSNPQEHAVDPYRPLIDKLYSLARDRNEPRRAGSEARQRLAELRAGAAFTVQGALRMIPALYHCAGKLEPEVVQSRRGRPWSVPEVAAALFAMAPEQRQRPAEHRNMSLASALGKLWRDSAQNDSVEKRFLALVNTRSETLPTQLRHAVRLLDSHGIEFDWYTLPANLRHWSHADRWVQRCWLRQFYGAPVTDTEADTESATGSSEIADIDQEGDEKS